VHRAGGPQFPHPRIYNGIAGIARFPGLKLLFIIAPLNFIVLWLERLMGDPYFLGGGFHEIFSGGKLAVHADFRVHKRLNLERRINVLLYLNESWDYDYGGELELWDKSMDSCFERVVPVVNRCVIFNTDSRSFHGHPDPLKVPEGVTRKSLALYYYTASPNIIRDTPAHSTMYVSRADDAFFLRRQAFKLRLQNYLLDWMPPAISRKLRIGE
jgi:hypothetical protein